MKPVTEDEVLRYWLEQERAATQESFKSEALTSEQALDALLDHRPGAASFIWRERPIRWYRHTLSRDEFTDLHLVDGPSEFLWGLLSPNRTVLGAAERIAEESVTELERKTGVDVRTILEYRDMIATGECVGSLVVTTRRGCTPWVVVDGNHRAVARALHLLDTQRYEPQPVFLAVTSNPVLKPLRERFHGLLYRLVGRSPARKHVRPPPVPEEAYA